MVADLELIKDNNKRFDFYGMVNNVPARIEMISRGSIAEELEIVPGDVLLSINGHPINDILDYQFYAQDDFLQVEIEKENRELWSLEIEKSDDEDLGMEFADLLFDCMKSCQNRCVFCFIDQLPANMRPTLHVKDDDYRHSFLYGNFITLTNLSAADWEKIEQLRLSPLYVSVHCIQKDLRKKMLQNARAGTIKEDLQRLKTAGIEVHTQIVLCPGWNDGEVLVQTINELADLYPGVASVGIVPVGLTGYRSSLAPLSPVSSELARDTIARVDKFQHQFRKKMDKGFVYLADEFYLRAGVDLPATEYYDDYCQIENGIGMSRWLLDEFAELEAELPQSVAQRKVYLLTGESGWRVLQKIAARLDQVEGLTVMPLVVKNDYFGGEITVTGLLTGRDIIAAMNDLYRGQRVIIPTVVFRAGEDMLLDDIRLEEIQQRTGADIRTADSVRGLIDAIMAE